jgi:imidazolonepropionase-like amidohydrolase
MSWSFEGTLLPDGDTGRLVVGDGDPEPLPGRYALVGLVDAHCHLTVADDTPRLDGTLAAGRLDALAAAGVGLVRDVGGDRSVTLPLGRAPAPGRPLVLAAGRFLAPPGRYFPAMHEPVEAADLVAAVEREVADGATWVKLVADFPRWEPAGPVPGSTAPTYPPEVVAAAIAAAHRLGARVAAHATSAVAGTLVAAGVDSVEHGTRLDPAALAALGAAGGAWTPTLCASIGALRRDGDRAKADALSERLRETLPAAVAAGVTVLAGTDVVGTIPAEVRLLVEHGLTPTQALAAAGPAARDWLQRPAGADLVTYAADPRADPAVLGAPAAVVLRGVRVR